MTPWAAARGGLSCLYLYPPLHPLLRARPLTTSTSLHLLSIYTQGCNIIPIPGQYQLEYGCNCLNLGLSTVISVHQKTARLIARSPHFKGDVFYVPFDQIVSSD